MTTPTNQIEIEIFVAMNEGGGWIVTNDESDALTILSEDEGGYQARVLKLKVKMAPPKMDEVEVTVPDEAGTTTAIPEVAS